MKKAAVGIVMILCIAGIFIYGWKLYDHSSKEGPQNPVYGGTEDGEWSGDRVYLGSYEQDNDPSDGQEPILWRVLKVEDDKMLLLSEYALDVQPFNDVSEEVTWENSTVRTWLNEEFYQTAFADQGSWKQEMVELSTCTSSSNPKTGADGGAETTDRVFLLSWEDTYNESYGFPAASSVLSEVTGEQMQYAPISFARLCYPTLYAANQDPLITRNHETRENQQGVGVDGFGSIYWILRTPGDTQKYISYVSRWGMTTYNFLSPVDHTESCIRPAVWVNVSDLQFEELSPNVYCLTENREQAEKGLDYEAEIKAALAEEAKAGTYELEATEKTAVEELSNPVYGGTEDGEWSGDRVYFGDVLWRVLDTDQDQLLLLSEYGLSKMKFSETKGVKWADSAVREWLNGEFLTDTFTLKEQQAIQSVDLENKDNARYGTDSGENTTDQVFLLSWDDVCNEKYGFTKGDGEEENQPTQSNTRICFQLPESLEGIELTTVYAKKDLYGNDITYSRSSKARWWLRTAGFEDDFICDVNAYGDVWHHEQAKGTTKKWVRPAIVLDKNAVEIQTSRDGFPVLTVK